MLGSTQRRDVVDDAAVRGAGVEVVTRHSGGGVVLLEPGAQLWVDVLVPAGDELWRDDVGESFHWLGEAWAAALGDVGVATDVHRGAMTRSDWSRLVCYAGRGPGEVFVDGAKVVGIAQRRTRDVARFQCAALLEPWRPRRLLDLLALDGADRDRGERELAGVARGLGLPGRQIFDAFLARLP